MLLYFAFTLFVSATLLFFVQPLVGKMILPRLGGTPAVWNTCMVFFQGILLVGYAYTHTLSNWQSPRRQLIVQLLILLLPFLVLPFTLGAWSPPTETNPVLSVLWLLLGMVGLPFFVVSTSAPLLQRWFGLTGHPAAKDPYFLYGASNLGSMLGLLAYPVLIEPMFDVPTQAWLWTAGYGAFALLVAGCVAAVWKQPEPATAFEPPVAEPVAAPAAAPSIDTANTAKRAAARRRTLSHAEAAPEPLAQSGPQDAALTWPRRLRWVLLSAVPSSLMLGLTTYLTTDIAAIPFFWIVPLALYLLTFILVFARWPVVWTNTPHTVVLYAQPCFLLFLVLIKVAYLSLPSTWMEFGFHILAFFTTTLMCHGELAKDRPAARHLTEFYLWMSVGGVVGGMFNALVAPLIFWFGVVEYSLAMVLSCFCRPRMVTEFTLIPGDGDSRKNNVLAWVLDFVLPAALGLAALFLVSTTLDKFLGRDIKRAYKMAIPVILVLTLAMRPLRFGLALGAVLSMVWIFDSRHDQIVFQGRGFFGFVKVRQEEGYLGEEKVNYHVLIHGGIDHGRQHRDPGRRRLPISYFHPTGGIGQVFQKFSWPDARLPASLAGLGAMPGLLPMGVLCDLHSEPPFAVVGLGTGTLAGHARPWQTMHIYEIDPLVRSLSEGKKPLFTYVADAAKRQANIDIIMGDGRLMLQRPLQDDRHPQTPPNKKEKFYHIIVLDAFSSDAIPVHLLTADAVGEYLDKLVDGGLLIFNTTNRYVNINEVLANIADHHRLTPLQSGDDWESIPDRFLSDWLIMQRADLPAHRRYTGFRPLDELLKMEKWKVPARDPGPVWTDAYSNLLRVIHWR